MGAIHAPRSALQELQHSYEERYVESLGARPTKAAVALVSKLSPIAPNGVELRLRKMGYQTDQVYVTPAPPHISERLLGGRRPAAARTMVRIAAANALPATAATSSAATPEPAGSRSRSASPQRADAAERSDEGRHNVFEEAVARFVFPYCLAPTPDRKAQQGCVDVRMPPRLGDVQPVAKLTKPASFRCGPLCLLKVRRFPDYCACAIAHEHFCHHIRKHQRLSAQQRLL